jgi:hypothetical protein
MRFGWMAAVMLSATVLSGRLYAQAAASGTVGDSMVTSMGTMPSAAPVGAKVFPLAEVRRGLHGVAYTVFEGVTPESMEVEILGVLKNAIGPGQDMILARLKGTKPEYTGVVAGMSGSPVYVDGRLVGALSYRIGQFSKEPICGITPIEQMLEVRDGEGDSAGENGQVQKLNAGVLRSAQNDTVLEGVKSVGGAGEVTPIETALVFGGFSQEAVDRFGGEFRALGMTPVAGLGGAAEAGTKQPEALVPGSAVSAVLVRGDLSISGTCTVTYVDATRLLACGHPITGYGPVSMPMTKAEVVATLASPLNAFKIINTTETVGSFTEDRASAILGRFGVEARMIPVSVDVVGSDAKKAGMRFEVLNNRELTPGAMLVSVYQSLSATNGSAAELSYRMSGELTVKGEAPVRLEGIMSPSEMSSGAIAAALYVDDRFERLYGNVMEQPEVTGLRLRLEAIPERRTAVLESARLGRAEAHAGETVEVEATLDPYQAGAKVVRIPVKLPESLAAGPVRIVVSDGATVDRLTTPAIAGVMQHPVALADAVAEMNRMHANDRVYVTLLDHAAQAELDASALPEVPLSMANVLEPLKASQKVQMNGESAVELGSAETGYAVSGAQVLTLTVR